jgi:hypothetical protein
MSGEAPSSKEEGPIVVDSERRNSLNLQPCHTSIYLEGFMICRRRSLHRLRCSRIGATTTLYPRDGTSWRGDDQATAFFFLDAVDELKLTEGKLERALRRLAKEIDGLRPFDWQPSTDMTIGGPAHSMRLPVRTT